MSSYSTRPYIPPDHHLTKDMINLLRIIGYSSLEIRYLEHLHRGSLIQVKSSFRFVNGRRRRVKIFDPIELTPKKDAGKPGEEEDHRRKKVRKEAAATARASAKDAAARTGDPDEEKYRAGGEGEEEKDGGRRSESKKKSGKKSLKELREERLKRERVEKERERALFMKQSQRSGGFSRSHGR
ncbi:hypothetical protein F2Q69_00004716 [Brassica cretica]|uniref:Uncharacterized protein n=1 Tax=Brassica cretica TaxID=69181 RepID=A0A8S9NYZ9_BRACR|nr:hypothetical protein F2Q69_00004716 [Brassica cretica]